MSHHTSQANTNLTRKLSKKTTEHPTPSSLPAEDKVKQSNRQVNMIQFDDLKLMDRDKVDHIKIKVIIEPTVWMNTMMIHSRQKKKKI
jgi:hypothetical protein